EAYQRAHEGGYEDRRGHREPEGPAELDEEKPGDIGAYSEEPRVRHRDEAGEPHRDVERSDEDETDAERRDEEDPEVVRAHDGDQRDGDDDGAEKGERPRHARCSARAPNRPDGRMSSTSARTPNTAMFPHP